MTLARIWRSISAKIQFSILHCTLHNLSYILFLSFEHSTLIHATFKFSLSTFSFSSSVECTFICLHPTFSICPLSFRLTFDLAHCTRKFPHSTFKISNWTFPAGQRPMEIVGSIDLTHPRSNGGRESVDRLPSGVDSGDLLHSRQTRRRQTYSPPCDNGRRSSRYCCTIC